MRVFTGTCIDKETDMEMVLSECSYNMACDWLMSKGFTDYDKFESDNRFTMLKFSKPAKRTFVYDEERGYLLAERG